MKDLRTVFTDFEDLKTAATSGSSVTATTLRPALAANLFGLPRE